MKNFDYSTYLSPFTWRYGSKEMREIWSETYKRKLWRKIWVELAKAQHKYGLLTRSDLDDLIKNKDKINIEKSFEFEKEINHDLMAEIKTYASLAKIGGGKIHLGATSMDIEDNADTIRFKESLSLIEEKLKKLLEEFGKKINIYKDLVCMAYTHLQPAEPTTLGYRFALYAQDILLDMKLLEFVKINLKGKGIKGAVGTSASFVRLLDEKKTEEMEKTVMENLKIESIEIASQVAPRKIEYFIASFLSGVAQSLHKFAFDVRIMQSPGFSEWQEQFSQKQVGSSAMPFKRNPIISEKVCSLARVIFNLSNISKDNASNMLLERTLDDSANRRIYLPEIFLAADEILITASTILEGLLINKDQIKKNLDKYGPFATTEIVLMKAVKNGADRQEMHEHLRLLSMKAWEELQENGKNRLIEFMKKDNLINKFIKKEEMTGLLNPNKHIGLAPKRCVTLLKKIENEISN
ncbi:MAG: adenylosuccinate lyase [Candidatus Levybacteria bacterium]|nr:adenylosuccinate lyase [Candidatus Levybacteria bacterium]